MKRYLLPESVRATRRTDRNLEDCLWVIMCPLTMAMLVLAVLMLGGCAKTVYVPVETVTVSNDSSARIRMVDRLIVERDTVNTYTKGDTVFKEVAKWRVREVATHDSLYIVMTDSVYVEKPYPVEVVREVERKLHWWQTALMWVGVVSLTGICVAVWWMVRKRK